MKTLGINVCATKGYMYAMKAQARAVQSNLAALKEKPEITVILATDDKLDNGIEEISELYLDLIPKAKVIILSLPVRPSPSKDYKGQNQLTIAQLRTASFSKARALELDYIWTLDSDVLPEPNNLRCMLNTLAFDDGYYSVAFTPYVAAGGGDFMGGRGTVQNHILPTVFEDERKLPKELEKRDKSIRSKLAKGSPSPEDLEELKKVREEVEKCPPKGNIFELQSSQWRKRGWLSAAYPALGKGAIVESDWMPCGNNLFSAKALPFLDFLGYLGGGTEDLHLTFKKLKPNGIRIAALPHCLSHHVQKKVENGREVYFMYYMRHETQGEAEGHLRFDNLPFYDFSPGELEWKEDKPPQGSFDI